MVTYAQRPDELDGCWSAWSETDVETTIRSSMDDSSPKVRRRFTGVMRKANVSVNVPTGKGGYFKIWFRTNCQQGLMPTNIVEPSGVESVWRFIKPPTYTWGQPGSGVMTVSAEIERLPGWQEL